MIAAVGGGVKWSSPVRLESTAKRYGIAKYTAQTSNNLKGLQ